jgi:hypothetical protein
MKAIVKKIGQGRVLRLCSVSVSCRAQSENSVVFYRQNAVLETLFLWFAIYCRLPKLDVAGSNPVSRSIF